MLKDGTIITCNTTTSRTYNKNCIIRSKKTFTNEQIKIMINEYERLDSLKKVVDEIKKNYDFETTTHYVNKYWKNRLDYL